MKTCSVFGLIGLICICLTAPAAATNGKVLVVQSYHADYDWCAGIDSAIAETLSAADIEFKTFYMDTKRKSTNDWKVESGRLADQELKAYQADVVITVDDNAQGFFAKAHAGDPNVSVVFCGVNADMEKYDFPAANVTGMLERTYPGQTLDLLKQIDPSIEKVAYIADDSGTASLVTPRIQAKAKAGELPVEIVAFERLSQFNEWQAAIEKYNADPAVGALVIPLYHTVKDAAGQRVKPSDVMGWAVDHFQKPIVGFWPFSADDGALCAVVVDPKEHGLAAAAMTQEILGGKKPGDVPVATNQDGFAIVNVKTAEKLGVNVSFDILQNANKVIE